MNLNLLQTELIHDHVLGTYMASYDMAYQDVIQWLADEPDQSTTMLEISTDVNMVWEPFEGMSVSEFRDLLVSENFKLEALAKKLIEHSTTIN